MVLILNSNSIPAPSPPEEVEVCAKSLHSVEITWEKPKHPNGLIDGYQASWRKVGESDESIQYSSLIEKEKRYHTIWALNSKINYQVNLTVSII